jgi:hypothetical protein
VSQNIRVETSPLRVAAVPAQHAYIQNSTAFVRAEGLIALLADPAPPEAPVGQWWPPVMLDPQWIDANASSFDLMHVHFGIESFDLAHLEAVVDALHRTDHALVFTVHDLENPQLSQQALYRRQLTTLVEGADELITLTEGAARHVETVWGRQATVIPHPSMLSEHAAASIKRSGVIGSGALRLGVHLRDLRPNIDALGTVRLMISAAERLVHGGRNVVVVVDVNDRVRDEDVREQLRRLTESSPLVEFNEHPRATDDELAASIADIDIEVLPYRYGTHSGWLELCWDIGVGVLAPEIGFYSQQHPDESVAVFTPGSATSFVYALDTLIARDDDARAAVSQRRMDARQAQNRAIGNAHLDVYVRALSRVRA